MTSLARALLGVALGSCLTLLIDPVSRPYLTGFVPRPALAKVAQDVVDRVPERRARAARKEQSDGASTDGVQNQGARIASITELSARTSDRQLVLKVRNLLPVADSHVG